ncbi:MAG: GNAT family N-acetyltransferase [Cyanobacteria bacterium SZAS LIN-2]|nr:GNAT family N-acetyltransferase [Cyanobacteria bacterium SZAS LIN-2]MBS2007676.1 GNAT family N-acetyltransferase [Cyanobacteria bacterium SZAS TMP-1]
MLTIRNWTEADARGMLEVHYAAVHGAPVNYYDEDRLDEWSPVVNQQRIESFLSRAAVDDEITRVAVQDDVIVGFGTVVPVLNELRACYVHPRNNRQGIGKRLIEELEKEARAAGAAWLNLHASLNAEEFYRAAGYVSDGLGRHRLSSGHSIACVHMYKFL